MTSLLPPAELSEIVRGRARLVGARLDPTAPRGFVSPVEARLHLGIPYGDLAAEEASYLRKSSARNDVAVLARAIITRVLATPKVLREQKRLFLVSAFVDDMTIEAAVGQIVDERHAGRSAARMIHIVHPHALNVAFLQPGLRERLAHADRVFADGVGLRVAARLLGTALTHNVNGTDLLPLLCTRLATSGRPLALIGAADGVAASAATELQRRHPGLRVPIVHHGFPDSIAIARLRRELGALGDPVVLIGMGTPVQERFAWEHLADLEGLTVVTVGGLFDFASGNATRAPLAWRELGLEWAYRLSREPRRLAARYLVGNPAFLALAAAQRLRAR